MGRGFIESSKGQDGYAGKDERGGKEGGTKDREGRKMKEKQRDGSRIGGRGREWGPRVREGRGE